MQIDIYFVSPITVAYISSHVLWEVVLIKLLYDDITQFYTIISWFPLGIENLEKRESTVQSGNLEQAGKNQKDFVKLLEYLRIVGNIFTVKWKKN